MICRLKMLSSVLLENIDIMEKALIFKEWIKTRMVFFISLGLAVSIALYAVVMMNRLIELKGIDHLWLIMLLKDNTFLI